jgi:hypothetical protein
VATEIASREPPPWHNEALELKHIAEYVDEFLMSGPNRFAAAYPDPMIVLRDLGYEAEDEGADFHTKYMSRGEAFGSTRESSPELTSSLGIGTCIRIAKREGAAFQDRIGVGRARNADVSIPLALISKYHAFFTKSADGKSFEITDAGSKNGTFIEGERLPEKQAVSLSSGQEISFGPYRFGFFTPEGFADMIRRRASVR